MQIENGRDVLDISDDVLYDGEVCIEIQRPDYPNQDIYMYINKEQTEELAKHLKTVFDMNKETNNANTK